MSPPPLVSIVLPIYNGSRYLEGAMRSCLAQTYSNLELIIVDDASTDETPAILQRLAAADARVRVHRNATNQRLPRSLNIGFAQARGELLTWTSDDNLYEPEAIAVMVQALEERPDVGLVYCDYRLIGPEGEFTGLRVCEKLTALTDLNCVGACFLYRRAVFEAVGDYDPNAFLAEDYDYWLRVSKQFTLRHLPVAPYQYRAHEASLGSFKNSFQVHRWA